MNIRQLITFVRVAELGSFAAAAKALHSTPSTISTRIRELEAAWGVELFDRGHRHRLQLRPKGEEILPWARQIVGLSDRIGYQLGEPEALTGLLRVRLYFLPDETIVAERYKEIRDRRDMLSVRATGLPEAARPYAACGGAYSSYNPQTVRLLPN